MKREKGFTLIELLAVIVILGVIMLVAIPNVTSTLEKNKKDTYIKDAKKMTNLAEYKIVSDTSIEFDEKDANTAMLLKLTTIEDGSFEESSFGTLYSLDKSFVVVTFERVGSEYKKSFYVHLVSCTDAACANLEDNSVAYNVGINLTKLEDLDRSSRFDLVEMGFDVNIELINQQDAIKGIVGRDNIISY